MKKTLRIIFFLILFIAGGIFLYLYFAMKRGIPEQAICIPKNSFAVLTLNVRELASDYYSEENSNQTNSSGIVEKEIATISKAIDDNGGAGIKKSADVLLFMFGEGESAYIGITFAVNDSSELGKLIRGKLANQFSLHEIANQKKHLFQYDTSSAIIGWNGNSLLFLYPFSDNTAENTSEVCARLLDQNKDASVLSDKNFCGEQLHSFDISLWIHSAPLLAFTNGGSLFKTQLDDADYISLEMNLDKGEINGRKIVTSSSENNSIPYNAPLLISCNGNYINGFFRLPLDLHNKNLTSSYINLPPLSALPIDEEQIESLLPFLDGNCTVLFHDTLNYDRKQIINEFGYYNSNSSNRMITSQKTKTIATTYCYGLNNEAGAIQKFSEIAAEDSMPLTKDGWTFSDNGLTTVICISNKVLTVTNYPFCDCDKRVVPDQWQGMDFVFSFGEYSKDDLDLFFPSLKGSGEIMNKYLDVATLSQPVITQKLRSSNFYVGMKNKKVNAVIQLKEMFEDFFSIHN